VKKQVLRKLLNNRKVNKITKKEKSTRKTKRKQEEG